MTARQHTPEHALAPDTGMTPAQRWDLFMARCRLESTIKISCAEQVKLEMIPADDLQCLLDKFNHGTPLRIIHRYLQMFYAVEIDCKALARYWRRTLPGYAQAETQQRELRTAERALRKLNQGD